MPTGRASSPARALHRGPSSEPAPASAHQSTHHAFATPAHLDAWLAAHHATATELWVRIYKKGSGIASVDWDDCVVAALVWGWIDGQRCALDDVSFLQRLTPRRARSSWSQRNRAHAERLVAERRMQPAGLAQVEAARADGRWDQAYAGSKDMVLPADLLEAVLRVPAAAARFATLNRQALFSIHHALHAAKRPETRAKRIAKFVEALVAEGGATAPTKKRDRG